MIPIICINLDRATERKAFIVDEWEAKRGCEIHYIHAYDRREIVEKRPYFKYDPKSSIRFIGRRLSEGEQACATSHVFALRFAQANCFEECIIIEDDILPCFKDHKKLDSMILKHKKEFPGHSISLLGEPTVYKKPTFDIIKKHFSQIKTPPWGNWCTYFKADIYESMIADLTSMRGAADHYWEKYAALGTLTASNTPLAKHCHTTTYIGNEFRGIHRDFMK